MNRAKILFKAEVEIEYDPAFFTEEWMAEYRRDFHGFRTVTDHLEHVAQYMTRFHGTELPNAPVFIEGYGYVKINGSHGWFEYIDRNNEKRHIEYDGLPAWARDKLGPLCPAINVIGGGRTETEPIDG
jgi:hypothetical protein